MQTPCNATQTSWTPLGRREIVSAFDGGHVSSDGGLLLLRDVAQRSKIFERFEACFLDFRDERRIRFTVGELLAQRVLGIICGYEDVADHDTLRTDPLLALAAGRKEVLPTDDNWALAGHATLHRLEHTRSEVDPRRPDLKIVHEPGAIEDFFVDFYLDSHEEPPESIMLDLDATDDIVHGNQEGRFFHGYYGNYCYLPLYIFAGDHLLVSKLRPANIDGAAGALEELQRVISRIRCRWPKVEICIRADSGFCRDAILSWCEAEKVGYVIGLARNARLEKEVEDEMTQAKAEAERTRIPVRSYKELVYATKDTWTCPRRVVAKVEALVGKGNPRFVVTNIPMDKLGAKVLYEDVYCARGDMENRIKEQQLGLFADRTSAHSMRANQLRLWFSSVAYVLLHELRRIGLRGTELATAQVSTIRTRLLKVGAIFHQSVRRIKVSLSSAFPFQDVWQTAQAQIGATNWNCGM